MKHPTYFKKYFTSYSGINVYLGARCSSVVEGLLMVLWVIGSIPHGYPLSYFSFQPVLHDWFNKGCGMCYPVCLLLYFVFKIFSALILLSYIYLFIIFYYITMAY